MFDRLVDLIAQFAGLFRVGVVIDCYERGVRLRWGRAKEILEPGFHWIIPLGVDTILTTKVVLTSLDLPAQAMTTRDNQSIVASAVVIYKIRDPMVFLTQVDEAQDVLADASRGAILDILTSKTWEQISCEIHDISEELYREIRKSAFRWGVEVTRVSLSDVSRARSIRLLSD